jgi:hypothetical protein
VSRQEALPPPVRGSLESIRFTVDLSTDSCKTMAFDIARGGDVQDDDDAVIWCPETSWR